MFRKDAFLAAGGYHPEERHAEDYALWGRLVGQGRITGVPKPMLDFRVHAASISKQKAETQMRLGYEIALRHCEQFMRLSRPEAERALLALRYRRTGSTLLDWCWLLTHCLPRLELQSVELWAWAAQASMRRLFFKRWLA
jgi:hypothetical protein